MFKRASWLAAVALAIAAAGCSGSDGAQGPQGPQGPAGKDGVPGPVTNTAESCVVCHGAGQIVEATPLHDAASATGLAKGTAAILTADFSPAPATTIVKPKITFQVKNAAGAFVDNWGAFNFTIAKLIPRTSTVPEHWINFIYSGGNPSRESGGANISGPTAGSSLTFDAGTHTYTYQFGTDIAAVGAPAVPFDPANAETIRVGLQITTYASNTPAYDMTNGVADFSVTGAGVINANASLSREIAITAACNQCHGRLTVHGRRVEVNYCTTCHNYGLTSGALSGDFTQFIHKIHGRDKLRSPTTPIFAGIVPEEITYPQSLLNCNKCHQGADGQRWNTNPSRYACTACHDDVTFDSASVTTVVRLHSGGQQINDNGCLNCHVADGSGMAKSITAAHANVQEDQGLHWKAVINAVTPVSGKFPAITFSVVDPLNSNAAHALSEAAWKMGGNSSLAMLVGFANTDFQNNGVAGSSFGQPLNVNLLSLTPGGPAVNGMQLSGQLVDGSYVLTIDQALPASVTGASGNVDGTVALQGHPGYFDPDSATTLRLPMKNASKAFRAKGTGTASARRTVVDVAKCNNCHFNLSLHGNNRTGDITTCTMCHNTEATDGSQRPNFKTPGAVGIDNKLEEGIDYKYLIHKIHGHSAGEGIVIYGYGGSVNDFRDVAYPNVLSNCQACHVAGAYLQPQAAANGTSVFAGLDRANGTDNLRTTKYLATCGGCHDSGAPAGHIQQMGGQTGLTQTQINALQ